MATVEVPVPDGMSAETFREYMSRISDTRATMLRITAELERSDAEVGPAAVAQLAQVEHLWRHLIDTYGVYTSADIAALHGAKPGNRSIATNLAKLGGLIGFTRGRRKLYPRFEFDRGRVHPNWSRVSNPLIQSGWDPEDVLLWMVSENVSLNRQEPAELINTDADTLQQLVEREALGVW